MPYPHRMHTKAQALHAPPANYTPAHISCRPHTASAGELKLRAAAQRLVLRAQRFRGLSALRMGTLELSWRLSCVRLGTVTQGELPPLPPSLSVAQAATPKLGKDQGFTKGGAGAQAWDGTFQPTDALVGLTAPGGWGVWQAGAGAASRQVMLESNSLEGAGAQEVQETPQQLEKRTARQVCMGVYKGVCLRS